MGADPTGVFPAEEETAGADTIAAVSNEPKHPLDFFWDGTDYLVKMYRDLSFLDKHQPVSLWMAFRGEHNPFLVPPHTHRYLQDKEYIPKMSKKMRTRATHALTIIKKANERWEAQSEGKVTRFSRFMKHGREEKEAFDGRMLGTYDKIAAQYNEARFFQRFFSS